MYFPGLLQIQNRLGLQAAWIGFSLVSFFHQSSPPAAFISLFDTSDPAHASLSQFSISIRIAIAVSPRITQGTGNPAAALLSPHTLDEPGRKYQHQTGWDWPIIGLYIQGTGRERRHGYMTETTKFIGTTKRRI